MGSIGRDQSDYHPKVKHYLMFLLGKMSTFNHFTSRTLDISSSSESQDYDEPEMNLAFLVESLPNLIALDISGTNLAGFRKFWIKGCFFLRFYSQAQKESKALNRDKRTSCNFWAFFKPEPKRRTDRIYLQSRLLENFTKSTC